jgi:hypothetical protein
MPCGFIGRKTNVLEEHTVSIISPEDTRWQSAVYTLPQKVIFSEIAPKNNFQ